MSVGDIFDEAFDLYKRNFALFAGVVAVVNIPAQIGFAAAIVGLDLDKLGGASRSSEQVGPMFAALGVLFAVGIVYHFLYVIHSGALAIAVTERMLGRPVTIGQAYRRLRPNLFKLLITWLFIDTLVGVIGFAALIGVSIILSLIMAAVVGASGGSGDTAQALATTMIVASIILIFLVEIAVIAWAGIFSTHAVAIEGAGYMKAMQRNWNLLRGRFWAPFWTGGLLVLLIFGMQAAIEGSLDLLLGLSVYNWMPVSHLSRQVIEQALATIVSLFVQPFIMITLTVLYFDQRMRREGFDIELALHNPEYAAQGTAG